MHVASSDSVPEPNLVPLLDLVLQLIMFFVVVYQFIAGQVDKDIMLPSAQSARPLEDRQGADMLMLNLSAKGQLSWLRNEKAITCTTVPEMRSHLRQEYSDAERIARELGRPQANVIVILRADRNTDYAYIYTVLRLCKEVGFRRLQLRAEIKGG